MQEEIEKEQERREQEIDKLYFEKHVDALLQASKLYDKAILSLSTASLGFIFALVQWKNNTLSCKCLLILIWILLILAMATTILSFLIDQYHSADKMRYYSYQFVNKKTNKMDEPHQTGYWMEKLSIISGLSFIFATILFTIFVGINIK